MVRSRDGFQTTETVGEGDESWRAVSIQFEKDAMFYGTDAEFRANHIFQMDRDSLERTNLGEVNGTVFYSKKVGDDLFFATTAENAPSQKENVAAIWHVSRSGELRQIAKFHKDGWNGTFFMFGIVHFPNAQQLEGELYFSLVGVIEDNRTFRIRRK